MSSIFEKLFEKDEKDKDGEKDEAQLADFDQTNELMRKVHEQLADLKYTDRLIDELFTDDLKKGATEPPRFSVSSGILYDILRMIEADPFTALSATKAQAALILITAYIEEGQRLIVDQMHGK